MASYDFEGRRLARQQEVAAASSSTDDLRKEVCKLAGAVAVRAAGKQLDTVIGGNKVTFTSGHKSVSVTIDGHNSYTFEEIDQTPGYTRPLVPHSMLDEAALLDDLDYWIERLPTAQSSKALGHADSRMVDKHHAHLAPSYLADTIRSTAPDLTT